MNQKFPKREKLKSSKAIENLFLEGKSNTIFPLKMVFKPNSLFENRVAFSVPKRKFKRAVDRNRIKRQLRETYRLNKYLIENDDFENIDLMFIYLGNNFPEFRILEKKMIQSLKFLAQKNVKKNTTIVS